MDTLHTLIVVACITGAGIITGLLYAFSNFVLKALADLPADKGMFAMQRINEKILNPVFFLLFFGTPILCLAIVITGVLNIAESTNLYLLIGAITYLIGPFAITVFFNVPLNNLLARTEASDAGNVWPMYQVKWQRWNHIRTYLGIASVAMMGLGLGTV